MSQETIVKNLAFFLKQLGDENLSRFSGGLCSAFSLMRFRSILYGLEDKNWDRMEKLVGLKESEIAEMANSYKEYKNARQNLLEKPTEENIIKYNLEVETIYKELRTLREKNEKDKKENKENKETAEQIVAHEERLRHVREEREKSIQKNLHASLGEEKWNKVFEAEDLYLYTHTLAQVFDPGKEFSFHIGDKFVNQEDFIEILEGLKLQPLPEILSPDKKADEKEHNITVTEALEIAFNFTEAELIKFFNNEYNDNTICKGDLISLGTPDHAIFLHYNERGLFQLYDPELIELTDSPRVIVATIKEQLHQNDFISLGITIFTKEGQIKRPNRIDLLEKIVTEREQNSVDINGKTADNLTSAHMAALYGHDDTIMLLRKHGADLNQVDTNGWTAAMFAAQNGHAKIIKTLAKDVDINDPIITIKAVKNGHLKVIDILDELKVNLNTSDSFPVSILYKYADITEHQKELKQLFEQHGISDNSELKEWTPLLAAVFYGHANVVERLLEKQVSIHAETNGITARDLAVAMGHPNIVSIIDGRLKLEDENAADIDKLLLGDENSPEDEVAEMERLLSSDENSPEDEVAEMERLLSSDENSPAEISIIEQGNESEGKMEKIEKGDGSNQKSAIQNSIQGGSTLQMFQKLPEVSPKPLLDNSSTPENPNILPPSIGISSDNKPQAQQPEQQDIPSIKFRK